MNGIKKENGKISRNLSKNKSHIPKLVKIRLLRSENINYPLTITIKRLSPETLFLTPLLKKRKILKILKIFWIIITINREN